jgi:hypothetical protein
MSEKADVLAKLSPMELAAWYGRLADLTAGHKWGGTEQLASKCLRIWLENKEPYRTVTISAPDNLRNSPYVTKELKFHRSVYLSEEKARVTSGDRWAGIVPRLQGKGFPKLKRLKGIPMEYESLVRIPITSKLFGEPEDKQLLYALHGLQLCTEVTVSCSKIAGSTLVQVVFVNFQAKMKNRYEWNPDRHIKVPNPDFKSRKPKAVAPDDKYVTVENIHAKRLEEAGLAAPYYLESDTWYVDPSLRRPGRVDSAKKI